MAVVPTLNIKDPEVYRLAAELAKRRGTSMTAVVREALEEAMRVASTDREARVQRIMDIGRRSVIEAREHGYPPMLTDDDLYDEWGLPK